jgi:predicted phage terminase large subunit-like protein
MTWWQEDDWAGRIQQVMAGGEGDEFEIVRYPAINETGDEYILADDSIVEIPPGAPVPEDARMTRPHNSALHPARYSLEAMLRKKSNYIASGLKRMWDALYQQNPTPDEGIYFSKDMFRYYVHNPDTTNRFVYQTWDFAITTGEQNDWTVGTTLLQDEYDNLYVLDVLRFRSDDSIEIVETILDYSEQWKAGLLGFEDGQIWKAMSAQFKKRCEERRLYPTYELLVPLTDKLVRANPLKGRMQLGKVYFPKNASWFPTLQKEMLRFPAGKHDDQVDSLAWSIRLTLSKSAPKLPEHKKLPSWRDKLNGMMKTGGSHMSA